MKHCGTQELETERLVLRRLSIDDSEMMYNNWASDRQVTQYLRWNAHRSWGETAETLNEWEKHYDDPAFYQWGITDRHTKVLFGTISLFPAPAQSQRIRSLSNARRKSRYLASIQEHIRIVDALLQGDGERAATEVLEHLHNSEDGYRRMMLEDAPDMIQMY